MGGAACQIIIQGQALTGNVLGAYKVLTYGELDLDNNKLKEVLDYLTAIRNRTQEFINEVNLASDIFVYIGLAGAQVVGNLTALCDSAVTSMLDDEKKEQIASYLEEQRKVGDKWLKILLKEAKEEEY